MYGQHPVYERRALDVRFADLAGRLCRIVRRCRLKEQLVARTLLPSCLAPKPDGSGPQVVMGEGAQGLQHKKTD